MIQPTRTILFEGGVFVNIPKVNRLSVHAAIEQLLSGTEEEWLSAARIVVEFGKTIQPGDYYAE
ncbi:MAG: hypothetical protein RIQ56_660, partial [Candidatus Parcubacteria bacterium]